MKFTSVVVLYKEISSFVSRYLSESCVFHFQSLLIGRIKLIVQVEYNLIKSV